MTATSNREGGIIPNRKMKALIIVFQNLIRVRNMSILGKKLNLESIIMSYMPQDFHSSPYCSDTLSSYCKYSRLSFGQLRSSFGWQEIENQSSVSGSLNLSGRMKNSVTWENKEGLVQRGPKIYVPWAWSYGIMLSAPVSSSEEKSLTGWDEDAIWVIVGLPTDWCEQPTDKWIEELSDLEEDELSN